jgi:hypothetical protein
MQSASRQHCVWRYTASKEQPFMKVEIAGIEPATLCMLSIRAANCAKPPCCAQRQHGRSLDFVRGGFDTLNPFPASLKAYNRQVRGIAIRN